MLRDLLSITDMIHGSSSEHLQVKYKWLFGGNIFHHLGQNRCDKADKD
jgi:hypothetical protein